MCWIWASKLKVADLARDMIRLSGLEEGKDIDIVYTGLQPGEKMEEELIRSDEVVERTAHEKIMMCRQNGVAGDGPEASGKASLESMVDILLDASRRESDAHLEQILRKIVPEFNRFEGGQVNVGQAAASERSGPIEHKSGPDDIPASDMSGRGSSSIL